MKRALFAAVSLLALSCAASAQQMDEESLRALILQTIRDNPEVIMEAIETLQAQEAEAQAAAAAAALTAQMGALQNDPNAPVLGNPDGDITVVEFFDYNCGYCRRVFPNVKALMEEDTNIRVVMREWPILGEESVFAARASLASRKQGKYEEFHNALMGANGRASQAVVLSIADDLGMDIDQLRADMESPEVDAHINTSRQLTQALGVNGTPAFVFEDQLVPGAIELEQMKQLVEELRG
ncbi:MAG: DsbA family protein [Litoreibacter sp.]|nr:DsbA family protein [Litoreibacter sp.]